MIETPYKKNRAFASAYRRGYNAARGGFSEETNPYSDARTYFGGVTFARAFWRAWQRGFEDWKKEQKESIQERSSL